MTDQFNVISAVQTWFLHKNHTTGGRDLYHCFLEPLVIHYSLKVWTQQSLVFYS